jgi:hypothetical protein
MVKQNQAVMFNTTYLVAERKSKIKEYAVEYVILLGY